MKQSYFHLNGIELLDINDHKDMPIAYLIGTDFCWPFVTGNIQRVKSGPIEIQTTLGWVLNESVKIKTTSSSLILVHASYVIHIRKISVNIKQDKSICETGTN